MAIASIKVFTCDRCSCELQMPINDRPPMQWIGVEVFAPATSSESTGQRKIFCGECGDVIYAAFHLTED